MKPPQSFSRNIALSAAILAAAFVTPEAQAAFHLWQIREIYSDNTGAYQFIEFFTPASSQQFVGGQSIQLQNIGGSVTHTLTLPSNLPGDTLNHTFLVGTAGIHAAGAPTPDFIMPDNFLFAAGGTINFFGANSGPYTAIPTDGVQSRAWGDGNAVNSPQNFAGQTGMIVIPEPAACVLLGIGVLLTSFLGSRRSA